MSQNDWIVSWDSLRNYVDKAVELTMGYAPKVLLALLVLFVGLKIIKAINKIIHKTFDHQNIDPTLKPFVTDMVNWVLKILLFISVASMVGITTTSFVAVIGAAGLAVGLALQGTLANFAGGVLILLLKPFRVGDIVEVNGYLGHVQEIQIFLTKIVTRQNQVVVIPNGELSNNTLKNWSVMGHIRVDLVLGISYNDNIKAARDLLVETLKNSPHVLQTPAPFVGVDELGDNSVNLVIRPWCNPEDYWKVRFQVLEDCKMALDKEGFSIPFPQRDVHLFQQPAPQQN